MSKTGDDPSFKQLDVSAEFAKRITEDFAISIAPTWSRLYAPGGLTMNGARGFHNLATLFKYRLFKNDEHEFVMSAGLEIEWGGSGAQGVGAERFNVYTPTIFFGKGFGDFPASLNWARPFAVTGQVGYSIPGVSKVVGATVDPDTLEQDIDTEYIPRVLNWGATLQYSMPYLKSAVVDLGLPDNKSDDPDRRSFVPDAGIEYGDLRRRDDRHDQSWHHLYRQNLPGGRRSGDPGEPPERHKCWYYRPVALLP